MGEVSFGGVTKEVCLAYVPDIEVGEYTIVHVGFALQRLDEASAMETLALFRQMGELDVEFGDHWGRAAEQAGMARPEGTPGASPGLGPDLSPGAGPGAAATKPNGGR